MLAKKIVTSLFKKIPTPFVILAAVIIVGLVLVTDPSSLPELLPAKEGKVLSKTIQILQDSGQPIESPMEFDEETVLVTRVVDGDTIEIEGGQRVRYIGIDTPESKHPSKPVQCFSKEATERNKELVEGKEVQLEKDVNNTDRYGRLLRYVYVNGEMVNKTLVSEGFAAASAYPPDIKYQEVFDAAQRIAEQENRGLWGDVCLN